MLAIFWHHIGWQWHDCRKTVVLILRLARVYLRSVRLLVPLNFSYDDHKVVARLPHGGRTFTCHFSETKLIADRFLIACLCGGHTRVAIAYEWLQQVIANERK